MYPPDGCDCRVDPDFHTCANHNWDQYNIGTRYTRTVTDAVKYSLDTDTNTFSLLEVQRQECFITSNDGEGSSDGSIPPHEVACYQCQLCRNNNQNNPECPFDSDYEGGDFAALEDGCDDFEKDPISPTAPLESAAAPWDG